MHVTTNNPRHCVADKALLLFFGKLDVEHKRMAITLDFNCRIDDALIFL